MADPSDFQIISNFSLLNHGGTIKATLSKFYENGIVSLLTRNNCPTSKLFQNPKLFKFFKGWRQNDSRWLVLYFEINLKVDCYFLWAVQCPYPEIDLQKAGF